MNEWTNEWMNEQTNKLWMNKKVIEWMNLNLLWISEWMNKWKNEWMNE